MRWLTCLCLLSLNSLAAHAQFKEERRFDIRFDADLYPQGSAKQTLAAALRSLDKDRYDYLVAFLIEPGFVDQQVLNTQDRFETVARLQVEKENSGRAVVDRDEVRKRIKALATQASFEHLVRRVRTKLDNDPDAVKEMKSIYTEGVFQDAGETSVAKHKDIKDHALHFRRIGERWYLENSMLDE